MVMEKERCKVLHNFTMPADLRWGKQRLMRCGNPDSGGGARGFPAIESGCSDRDSEERRGRRGGECGRGSSEGLRFRISGVEDDDGIAAVRAKVMLNLQTAADKLKGAILKDGFGEREPCVSRLSPARPQTSRPWNLRTRGVKLSTTRRGSPPAGNSGGEGLKWDSPQTRYPETAEAEQKKREKFSVSLSKQMIEQDFLAITGHRPPRRQKKRPKIVQNSLDELFPGLRLKEVTADMYKVAEAADANKKKKSS